MLVFGTLSIWGGAGKCLAVILEIKLVKLMYTFLILEKLLDFLNVSDMNQKYRHINAYQYLFNIKAEKNFFFIFGNVTE